MKVLIAHPGTQYSFSLARELSERGLLLRLHTGAALCADSRVERALGAVASELGFGRVVQNRFVHHVARRRLRRYPLLEINTLRRIARGGTPSIELHRRNGRFQESIPESELAAADVVIGFDTSSWRLAQRTKAADRHFVLDRSIGHARSYAVVAAELARRYPEWPTGMEGKSEALIALEDEEHSAAAVIVVPSEFAASTLRDNGVDSAKIRVIPFGTDTDLFHPGGDRRAPMTPLRVMFAGALSARKGVPVLLDAWRRLRPADAELHMVGTGDVPASARAGLTNVTWKGAMSRAQLAEALRAADLFVFPSHFEGLAQVQLEAAAAGLPIVTTGAAGGAEIVDDGANGLIIAPGDHEALASAIDRLLSDRTLLRDMRQEARARYQRWSWANYGDRWAGLLHSLPLRAPVAARV